MISAIRALLGKEGRCVAISPMSSGPDEKFTLGPSEGVYSIAPLGAKTKIPVRHPRQ